MSPAPLLNTGLDVLLREGATGLRGRRVGLLTHAAAVDRRGRSAADVLRELPGFRLTALFGPEHGVEGTSPAGEPVATVHDVGRGLTVFSLYGDTRRPTAEMLRGLDVLLCDLQDIGVRCYTYVSTLRYMLEAAAAAGLPVIVADRPVPLPRVVDGPMLDPALESFVGAVPAPLQYGMTPGETARWLRSVLRLDLDLEVISMEGFTRNAVWGTGRKRWVAPSPALQSWGGAACYAGTVLAEALPALNLRRDSLQAFEGLAAPWIRSGAVRERLQALRIPGCRFDVARYPATRRVLHGIRIRVTDPETFRPVLAGVALLDAIAREHGVAQVWADAESRGDHFDRLAGTDALRLALRQQTPPAEIAAGWAAPLAAFRAERESALLYRAKPGPRPPAPRPTG